MTDDASPLEPIAVGSPTDPAIAALLAEMRQVWDAAGVPATISPREFTRLRKARGQPSAIPPRDSWSRTARFLSEVYAPIRDRFGGPIFILNGYRPADYNKAVGGAPRSLHTRALAIDAVPVSGSRERLASAAASVYLERGQDLGMGLGIYGATEPSVHVDALGRPSPRAGWTGAEATTVWLQRARGVA